MEWWKGVKRHGLFCLVLGLKLMIAVTMIRIPFSFHGIGEGSHNMEWEKGISNMEES